MGKIKIYKVMERSIYAEEGEEYARVKVFTNKENALEYLKRSIEYAKQDIEDLSDYCIEETEESYERYLDGYAMEDCISIYLEEDVLYEGKFIEKDSEYEY